ncbi:MAG: STAS domain-containing protein [Candidatus Hydrogenedentes bacterium]|nr:STAS domain-containing protein [Candidatus Hydrogenedentota bacterium]
MLHIDRLESGSVTVLRLEGDIDEDGMNELRLALMGCIQDHRYNVVVNLEGVKFVSYMGVGVLVERLRQLRGYGGDMKLVHVNLYTQRLFRMIGVTHVFELFDGELIAIQKYQKAA